MVPRADIVAVQQDISLGELIKVFEGAGHSRLVVYNDTLDDPVGMAHIRDLVAYMAARATVKPEAAATARSRCRPISISARSICRCRCRRRRSCAQLLFVPPSMPVIDLFAKMQATRIHLALVIDEYGGTDGLVSIEDIVEQIVGEIEDEHDEDEAPSMVRQPDGSFLADARASLEDVTATLGAEFDVGDAAEEVDTLGGYLFTKIGRVPVRGELVPGPGELRDRSRRCRSAAGEAAAHLSQEGRRRPARPRRQAAPGAPRRGPAGTRARASHRATTDASGRAAEPAGSGPLASSSARYFRSGPALATGR